MEEVKAQMKEVKGCPTFETKVNEMPLEVLIALLSQCGSLETRLANSQKMASENKMSNLNRKTLSNDPGFQEEVALLYRTIQALLPPFLPSRQTIVESKRINIRLHRQYPQVCKGYENQINRAIKAEGMYQLLLAHPEIQVRIERHRKRHDDKKRPRADVNWDNNWTTKDAQKTDLCFEQLGVYGIFPSKTKTFQLINAAALAFLCEGESSTRKTQIRWLSVEPLLLSQYRAQSYDDMEQRQQQKKLEHEQAKAKYKEQGMRIAKIQKQRQLERLKSFSPERLQDHNKCAGWLMDPYANHECATDLCGHAVSSGSTRCQCCTVEYRISLGNDVSPGDYDVLAYVNDY
jgi:hypothetical protein